MATVIYRVKLLRMLWLLLLLMMESLRLLMKKLALFEFTGRQWPSSVLVLWQEDVQGELIGSSSSLVILILGCRRHWSQAFRETW